MSTGFFYKTFKRIVAVCACAVIGVGAVCAVKVSKGEYLSLDLDCYFLCVDEGGVEACATQVAMAGGAGYVWEEKVVLVAYFTLEEAASVANRLTERYPSIRVEKLSNEGILVPIKKKKEVKSMLSSLHAHITAMADVASDLEEGLSQEKAKSRLLAINTGFVSMSKLYPAKKVQEVCNIANGWIQSKTKGVLFASELRHCVCELAVAFVAAVEGESL